MTARRFDCVQVDVFTARPLEGNPLAVFLDGRGLSDAEMQAIAKETNLSETTFVLPRDAATERAHGVRVRIFTVDEELPFAGHPTLGTAFVLAQRSGARHIRLELGAGTIPLTFEETAEGLFGEMRQLDPEFGATHSREEVARAAGLPLEAIADDLPIQTVSTGVAFAVVPLRSLAAVRSFRFAWGRMADYAERSDAKFLYFVCRETVDPAARLHARMVFYNGEDPATGSAAGCAAAWMVKHGVAAPQERVLIEQGIEVRRPSRIFVRAARDGDRIVNVHVGGYAVEIMRGKLTLPA